MPLCETTYEADSILTTLLTRKFPQLSQYRASEEEPFEEEQEEVRRNFDYKK